MSARAGRLRHDPEVSLIKCATTDAFAVIDLDGAPRAAGVVRLARKVLQEGAWNLARSLTYSYALLEMKVSGASAGINAEGDARAASIANFVAEISGRSEPPRLVFDAGKGVGQSELDGIVPADDRSTMAIDMHAELTALSIVTATATAIGGLDGRTVSFEPGTDSPELLAGFASAGASVIEGGLTSGADVLCVGSKPAVLDHDLATGVTSGCIVPVGPLAISPRALAVLVRAGATVLPGFVTLAGPLIAQWPSDGATSESTKADIVARITEIVTEVGGHGDGHVIGACERAEKFLESWASVPFGRPLA